MCISRGGAGFVLAVAVAAGGAQAAAAGTYRNATYGYAVTWAGNGAAQTDAAPAPQHGFKLVLGPGRTIWVDGSYDTAFLGSAEAALRAQAADMKLPAGLPVTQRRVGGLAAAGLRDEGAAVTELVTAYRPASDMAVLYSFGLTTDKADEARDETRFLNLLAGFRTESLPK